MAGWLALVVMVRQQCLGERPKVCMIGDTIPGAGLHFAPITCRRFYVRRIYTPGRQVGRFVSGGSHG